ncbi:MAG: O-antigen ligase family protein [Planctomycetota bacterium]
MNTVQTTGEQTDRSSIKLALQAVIVAIWLLCIFTFSAPEDWKAGTYGTDAILPPEQIKLLKLGARLSSCFALLLGIWSLWHRKDSGRVLIYYFPVILFSGWILATIFWSPLKTVSIQQAVSFAISICLAMLVSLIWKSEATISRILFHIVVVLALISVGLICLALAFPQYGVLTKESSGLFHSTTAGATASLGTILTISIVCNYGWNWSKFIVGPAVVAHLAVLILAGNRFSIILTVLFGALVIGLLLEVAGKAVLLTVIGGTCLIYLLVDPGLTLTGDAVDKVEEYARQGQSTSQLKTVSGREEMWSKMWISFQDSPVIGHGYFVTSETGRIHVWDEWGNWTAHSMYLQVLVSTGIVGMVLFLLAMLTPFAVLLTRITKVGRRARKSMTLLLIMGCWFAFWGILNSSVVGPTQPESVVFGVLYGAAIASVSRNTASPDFVRGRRGRRTGSLAENAE